MTDASIQIRWRAPASGGLDHCVLKESGSGVTLEGVALPGDVLAPALRYRIVVDADWAGLRSVHLSVLGGATLALRHDGYGGWTDGEGKPRKDLQGVTDIHFPDSPVLAMVMARRQTGKAKSAKLDVAAVDLAAFSVARAAVDLATVAVNRHWRASFDGGGAEDLRLGDDGILTQWGERFERVPSASSS